MKTVLFLICILFFFGCGKSKNNSVELITLPEKQNSLFYGLIEVSQHTIPESSLGDSLSFLVLPLQASCPACRKKTIDSIMMHREDLANKHYIIISANGGRKTIRGFFQEQEYEVPDIPHRFFLDSTNLAYKKQLYEDKPTIYYTFRRKAYKKVAAIPITVREDLREFFSGHRNP